MLSLLKEILSSLKTCLTLWRGILWRVARRPSGFGVLRQIREITQMAQSVFVYELKLLTPPADVASQRLSVTVGDAEPVVQTVDRETTSINFEAGPAGARVKLSLDYLDAAGNDSENLELEFDVEDKIAPAAPAGFGEITQVDEKVVE